MDLNIKYLIANHRTGDFFFFLPDLFFSHSHKPLPLKSCSIFQPLTRRWAHRIKWSLMQGSGWCLYMRHTALLASWLPNLPTFSHTSSMNCIPCTQTCEHTHAHIHKWSFPNINVRPVSVLWLASLAELTVVQSGKWKIERHHCHTFMQSNE